MLLSDTELQGELWASDPSSSADPCQTHCGTLGKSLSFPQDTWALANIGGL